MITSVVKKGHYQPLINSYFLIRFTQPKITLCFFINFGQECKYFIVSFVILV